jgi:hypothetical protein
MVLLTPGSAEPWNESGQHFMTPYWNFIANSVQYVGKATEPMPVGTVIARM